MLNERLQRLEARLLEERKAALRTLDVLREEVDASLGTESDTADPEAVAATQERLRTASALVDQETEYISYIDAALRRLYTSPETFGLCRVCGREIPLQRLLAVPHTRFCVECKTGLEGGGMDPAVASDPRRATTSEQ